MIAEIAKLAGLVVAALLLGHWLSSGADDIACQSENSLAYCTQEVQP